MGSGGLFQLLSYLVQHKRTQLHRTSRGQESIAPTGLIGFLLDLPVLDVHGANDVLWLGDPSESTVRGLGVDGLYGGSALSSQRWTQPSLVGRTAASDRMHCSRAMCWAMVACRRERKPAFWTKVADSEANSSMEIGEMNAALGPSSEAIASAVDLRGLERCRRPRAGDGRGRRRR